MERRFAHPPERLFEAWTKTDIVGQWLGCGADMLWHIHQWDVRVGGGLKVSLDYDGVPFVVEGEFLEVERPRHLKYRWGKETVDILIEPDGGGCRVTLRHEDVETGELGGILKDGWTFSLSLLEGTLHGLDAREEL